MRKFFEMDKVKSIGYTKKPHGLKGEIKLQVEERFLEDLLNAEMVILDLKGKKTPFFVEDIRVGNNIIAKFEDIDTPEGATSISSRELFLREEDILPDELREIEIDYNPYEHCAGYTIINDGETVGVIDRVEEFPQQEMAFLMFQEREILIPLNENFIKKVDDKAKTIEMSLPEGLLDL